MSEDVTWPELLRRTENSEWSWNECINCGSSRVETRGLILEDGPAGVLRRIAWCSLPDCVSDRHGTDYLMTPRARTAA